jgi:glycosyltransferase involved in cell wall biosynthesis
MKILAYIHGYPPTFNAGAEVMLHEILLELKARGHEIAVIADNTVDKEYQGIPLYKATGGDSKKEVELFKWCDLIFTHLNYTTLVMEIGEKYKKNIVHLLHNDFEFKLNHKVTESAIKNPSSAALVVANSNWVKEAVDPAIPSIVVNPPTKPDRYKVETTEEYVTFINLCVEKGADLFWTLAKDMKKVKFLGVKGSYGYQVIKEDLPNVTILENTTDMKSVYAKTKILIVPSEYESWGRVGTEAACSGIPVIASPTPGLKESLGDAGLFANPTKPMEWKNAILRLHNRSVYGTYSKLIQIRSEELAKQFDNQMDLLEKRLLKIVSVA